MSSSALSYVMSLLARREYSEFELRCKMQEKHISEQQIDDVLSYCQQRNWQSDKRFAENYLVFRSQRGYGLNRIKQELHQIKGVQSEIIQSALNEVEIDWHTLALATLTKKFPQFAEIKEAKIKQKVWRYMLSHGFSPDEFADHIGYTPEDE